MLRHQGLAGAPCSLARRRATTNAMPACGARWAQRRHAVVAHAAIYPESEEGGEIRTFTSYTIYTDQGAVDLKPIPPTFTLMQGSKGTYYQLQRDGSLLLEFANPQPTPASASRPSGARSYNWQEKKTLNFALKVAQLGEISDFDTWALVDGTQQDELEFVHEPNRASVVKTLRLATQPGGHRAGYLLSLSVQSGNSNTLVEVPITRPEFVAIKKMADFWIPRLYGFEHMF